jgi:cytochrome c biogenesis protein CcdA
LATASAMALTQSLASALNPCVIKVTPAKIFAVAKKKMQQSQTLTNRGDSIEQLFGIQRVAQANSLFPLNIVRTVRS